MYRMKIQVDNAKSKSIKAWKMSNVFQNFKEGIESACAACARSATAEQPI